MRKLLALFLAVVLVFPLALAALAVISVSTWVLDRSFYENLLGDTRLYEVMLTEDLPNYFNRRLAREIDSDLPAAAFGVALREVVTPEYLRDQALNIVDDLFDALEGRDPTLNPILDLTPVKAELAGDGGLRFSQALAEALPTCAPGQEPRTSSGKIMACRPTGTSVDEAADQIALALPAYVDKIPDHINLSRSPINMWREFRGVPIGVIAADGLGLAIVVMVALAGGVWLATAFVGGEDRRQRLMWLGWSLIVPAVLIFLIGLAINADFSLGWVRFGLNEARFEGVEYSESFRLALIDVARDALNAVANGFLMAGGVSGAIALALIVWGGSTPPEPRLAAVMPPAPAQPVAASVALPATQPPPDQSPTSS
jgi:hypothetical protein